MRIGSHDLATRAKCRRMATNLGRHVSQSKYLFNIILLLSNDTKLFNDVAEIYAQIKKWRVRGHRTPWMTTEVSELMKERDFHRRKTYGSKSGYHWNKFRNYRNLVRKGIKKAKSDYYTKLIEESKTNSSKLWSGVEQVLPSVMKHTFHQLT